MVVKKGKNLAVLWELREVVQWVVQKDKSQVEV
jgi:hypothetical protein